MMMTGFIGQRYNTRLPAEMHERLKSFFVEQLERRPWLVHNADARIVLSTGAGVDLPMIDAVKSLAIPATLVVPFPNHTSRWPAPLQARFSELSDGMDSIVLTDKYAHGVYDLRNLYIAKSVDPDKPLFVFWDGAGDDGLGHTLGIIGNPGVTHLIHNLAGDWADR